MIPNDYAAWRRCITEGCGIVLSPSYIEARLAVLRDPRAQETRKFRARYGEAHLRRVVGWFERARLEAS